MKNCIDCVFHRASSPLTVAFWAVSKLRPRETVVLSVDEHRALVSPFPQLAQRWQTTNKSVFFSDIALSQVILYAASKRIALLLYRIYLYLFV